MNKENNAVEVHPVGQKESFLRKHIGKLVATLAVSTALLTPLILSFKHDIQGIQLSAISDGITNKPIPATAQDISWLETEDSKLMSAGYDENGRFSINRAMILWHHAGIPAEKFEEILYFTQANGDVIVGSFDFTLNNDYKNHAAANADFIDSDYQKQIEKLNNPNWIANHEYKEVVDPVAREIIQDLSEKEDKAVGFSREHPTKFQNISITQARDLMEKAMEETGLKSLRLSTHNARDPEVMANIAQGLIDANEKLKERTGYEGAVLGLGGRVDMIFTGEHSAQRVQVSKNNYNLLGSSRIVANTNLDHIYHDWFKALDFVMSRGIDGYKSYSRIPLIANNDEGVMMAMNDLVKKVKYVYPENISHDIGSKRKSFMRNNGYEKLPLAFQADITSENSIFSNSLNKEQINKQSLYFDKMFALAKRLDLTKRMQTINLDNQAKIDIEVSAKSSQKQNISF